MVADGAADTRWGMMCESRKGFGAAGSILGKGLVTHSSNTPHGLCVLPKNRFLTKILVFPFEMSVPALEAPTDQDCHHSKMLTVAEGNPVSQK